MTIPDCDGGDQPVGVDRALMSEQYQERYGVGTKHLRQKAKANQTNLQAELASMEQERDNAILEAERARVTLEKAATACEAASARAEVLPSGDALLLASDALRAVAKLCNGELARMT